MAVGRLLLLAIVLVWGCGPPKPIVPPPLDQLTPLVGHVIAEPRPVLGADNRIHLVYELLLTNVFDAPATLDAVEVLNESRGCSGSSATAATPTRRTCTST